jgi:diguanylate cyclase (GGDEF)-like protein
MNASPGSKRPWNLSAFFKKLDFLKGNWQLLVIWPFAALILCTIGWGALIKKLDNDRQEIEKTALTDAAQLSRSYADRLARVIESIDQTILHIKYNWEVSAGRLQLSDLQEKGLFRSPSSFYVAIINSDGVIVTSTSPNTTGTRVNDYDYFLMQQNATTDTLYIGKPIFGRAAQRNVIPFSRKITDADGNFSGVVLVNVVLGYFTANYDDSILGKNGFLGVIGGDKTVRVTRTGAYVYPPDTQALVSFTRFTSPGGSVLLNGKKYFSDGRSRYVGWQQMPGYPLTALTGLDQQDTLAPYRANRAAAIRYATAATTALGVFTLIAMALSLRLAWRKHQMELVQATYRMATEEGNEGFYITRPVRDAQGAIVDFEIVDCNQRGAQLQQRRREELIGKRISDVHGGALLEQRRELMRQGMEKGFCEGELEEPGDSPSRVRWVHFIIRRSGDDLAITLRDVSDTKAHVAELERRGNEDALTGLPNRHWAQAYLPQAIAHAAENDTMLALLFIDLDGFKTVNDTLGHAAGDELLRNAARRLKDAVRPHDHVVRLGGDEFVVIIESVEHKRDAAHVAERILHAFHDGFRLSQGVQSIGTSIGISMFPSDGRDGNTLMQNADIAMYSVKTSGKRNYRFYDQKFYDTLRARLEKEKELRHAIEQDQFVMYYQPRVDISTGATSSIEALVRWAHPEKGLLDPREFILLAEETGLIVDLGELVIDKVCAQLAHWAQTGQELVPVSVNVSPRQFNKADVPRILSAALARHNVRPELIEVEVTESSMMGENPKVSQALATIQAMGIKLLVDDFGTGYSSLSQLQRMDFDVLKVDRAFTVEIDRTEQGNVFFTAIITMAHALGMRVVAEGVENERQIKILKSLRCDEIQGFFISKPMPASEMQPILPKWFLPSTI